MSTDDRATVTLEEEPFHPPLTESKAEHLHSWDCWEGEPGNSRFICTKGDEPAGGPNWKPNGESIEDDPILYSLGEDPDIEEPDERLAKALDLNARVMQARLEYERASEVAKSKKKAWEAYSDDLSDYLKSLSEEMPLFDKKPPAKEEPKPTATAPATGWEGTSLTSIEGIPPKALSALDEAGLITLGSLAEFTKTNKLTDVDGIGPATAEKIETALEGFWRMWLEKNPQVTGAD